MRIRFLAMSLSLLAGCVTPYWHEEHSGTAGIAGTVVIYTDQVRKFCDGADGCYYMKLNIIFVRLGDRETLQHESLHAETGMGDAMHEGDLFDRMIRRIPTDPVVGLQ